MAQIPQIVKEAWELREGPVVFATVSSDGVPNAIYATCVKRYDDERIIVADNYFSKTRENIKVGSIGAVVFITKDRKSYQVKGKIEYHEDGPIFDDMQTWVKDSLPRVAAATIVVDEVYCGAEKLL